MKFNRIGAAGTVAVVIGLMIAGFAYTSAQGSAVGESSVSAMSSARSPQADAVEERVVRTNLVHRLEVALGSGFGGAWLEPSQAQLRVGVTSPASRRSAEGVAAQAGLGEGVKEIPVRSSWEQLQAAQERWNRRLDDLFSRGEVTTWLSPLSNSVEVELGSEVSASRRAELERATEAASVGVSIDRGSHSHFRFEPQLKRCSTFKSNEALCEPPLVAGVTIKSPKEAEEAEEPGEYEEVEEELEDEPEYVEEEGGDKRLLCTAGPLAIPKNRTKPADATKTYVLTAGHCINEKKGGGGVGGKWDAYDKKGIPKGENELGVAAAYINSGTDVGAIEVTPGFWTAAKDPVPVSPTIAAWNSTAESDPFPVIKQVTPVLTGTTCLSGERTGVNCGKIGRTSVSLPSKKFNVVIDNLYEVEGVLTQKGDSGGPWFADSAYTGKTSEGYVEGTNVGDNKATGRPVFQSLDTDFAELEKVKGLALELLTQTNQRRHPAFTGDKYPSTVSTSEPTGEEQLTAFGATVKCSEDEFDGQMYEPSKEEETSSLELTPTYHNCSALSSLPVQFTSNECKYKFTLGERVAEGHYKAEVGIVCPEGKPGFQFHIFANHEKLTSGNSLCTVTVPPQSGLKTATMTNSSGKISIDAGTIEGIKVKIHRNNILCPSSGTENETTSGVYHLGAVTLAGSSEEKAVSIDIGGG